ncbi:DMT family transporter [Pseudothioclava arenosa]|nr:DMT family transporter [Pseudothioclava arenosa]
MSPLAWGLLLLLAMIWGSSFLSNRAALDGLGVFTTVTIRVTGGAALLWLWVVLRKIRLPRSPARIWQFLLIGFFANALPFSLIVWGQQHISSGLASILNASAAIFGVLIAALVFVDERMTTRKASGVALGFAGVVLAIGAEALGTLDLRALGQWAIIGSSLSYGIGAALARKMTKGLPHEVSAAGALTGAAAWMIPLMLWREGVPDFDWPAHSWAGVIWLAFACSALAYLLYFRVMELAGMANLSLVGLLIPPFAIVAGALAYDERLGLNQLAGFAVIALGLLILRERKA